MTAACGGKEEAETNEAPVETETQTQESKSKVVKLGNYKGVKAEAVSTEVTEEELQAEIDALEAQKQRLLHPVNMKMVMAAAKEAGLTPEEIAEKLGLEV